MPLEAGKIIWARHLFKRITGPIGQFPKNIALKMEFKKNLQNYNNIGLRLKMYEQWYFKIWCTDVIKAKNGLASPLLVRN